MLTTEQVIEAVRRLAGFCSAGDVGAALNITRQGAWKRLKALVVTGQLVAVPGAARGQVGYALPGAVAPEKTPRKVSRETLARFGGFFAELARGGSEVVTVAAMTARAGCSRLWARVVLAAMAVAGRVVAVADGYQAVRSGFGSIAARAVSAVASTVRSFLPSFARPVVVADVTCDWRTYEQGRDDRDVEGRESAASGGSGAG